MKVGQATTVPPRKRGFDTPLSSDQIFSWIMQPMCSMFFVLVCGLFHDSAKAAGIIIPYLLMVGIMGKFWYDCETIDPADKSIPVQRFGLPIPEKKQRYCTICRKSSPGLDHHCTWLNTCIAGNNYAHFLILIISALFVAAYQTLFGCLMVSHWYDEINKNHDNEEKSMFLALLWIHNAGAIMLTAAYASLTGFHGYLLYLQCGTYDWLIDRKYVKKNKGTNGRSNSKVDICEKDRQRSVELAKKAEQQRWKEEWIQVHSQKDDTTSRSDVFLQDEELEKYNKEVVTGQDKANTM